MPQFSVNPVLKGYVSQKTGLSQLVIDISFKSRHYQKSLAIKIKPEQFDGSVIVGHPQSKSYNAIIATEKGNLELALLELHRKGRLTAYEIKKLIHPGQEHDSDFYSYLEKQIEFLKASRSPHTVRNYNSKLTKLKEFDSGPVYFSDIDAHWLWRFRNWMKEKGNEHNTIWDTEKFLKARLNEAIPQYIAESPYNKMDSVNYEEDVPRFLFDEEVEKIEKFLSVLAEGSMKRAGIYFLLDCEIGLRISDTIKFDPKKDIKDGRLIKKTQKGKTIISMKLSTRVQELIKYVKQNPFNLTQPEYDRQLKKLGKFAGIATVLSSHVARHTLGKKLAKNRVNIKIAQLILGHKSVKSTERYYHLDNEDVDEAIDLISK